MKMQNRQETFPKLRLVEYLHHRRKIAVMNGIIELREDYFDFQSSMTPTKKSFGK
jgi:hypothetical protein